MATTLILIIIKTTNQEKWEINKELEKTLEFFPINISVLIVSDSRTKDTDVSGNLLINKIKKSGHNLINYEILKDNKELIESKILEWSKNKNINAIITSGGTGLTGRDVTPEALERLFDKKIDGFSSIFHMISFQKIKTSTIQSRATAGIIKNTYIFCLPGSPGAVKDAWDEILIYQLDIRHKPCNLIEIIERLEE
tara:strand:- start:1001 stop:1588 length:588 start_codon:yes stop_codon:yes gene_type:complete